jgi:hypothetical protein
VAGRGDDDSEGIGSGSGDGEGVSEDDDRGEDDAVAGAGSGVAAGAGASASASAAPAGDVGSSGDKRDKPPKSKKALSEKALRDFEAKEKKKGVVRVSRGACVAWW